MNEQQKEASKPMGCEGCTCDYIGDNYKDEPLYSMRDDCPIHKDEY